MKYCTSCLQPDTRPNTYFSKEGICPACNYHSMLKNINWKQRYKILEEICEKSRGDGKKFDCIIGVSGGKDSLRQSLFIRDKLKMKPLLVSLTHPPQTVTEIGVENLSNLINHGFDIIVSGPSPITWKKLMREGFLKYCNYRKSTEYALYTSVPQIAIRFNIPLIFWGENPGLQLGDMKTTKKRGWDGNNLRNMNTLGGGDAKWIKKIRPKLKNIFPYLYPDHDEFKKSKIQIVYLGWFWKDWSMVENGLLGCSEGLKIRNLGPKDTGDLSYVQSLEEDWVHLNQMIKYYKYGFGRATDYANDQIRAKKISKLKAIELVKKYDGKCNEKFVSSFCKFINISEKTFWNNVYRHTNRNLFKIKNKKIIPKFVVGKGI